MLFNVSIILSVLDSHPLLSSFQLMLLEHIIMCRLIMGNKTLAIQEVYIQSEQISFLVTVNLLINCWYFNDDLYRVMENRENRVMVQGKVREFYLGPKVNFVYFYPEWLKISINYHKYRESMCHMYISSMGNTHNPWTIQDGHTNSILCYI